MKANNFRSKNNKINHLLLGIGDSCFLRCSGCYSYFSKESVSRADLLYFVRFVRDKYKIKKITLCGGDPLSRKDIFGVLTDLKFLGLKIQLDTSGLPLLGNIKIIRSGKGVVKKIPPQKLVDHIDLLGLPIDSPNNKIVNYFRRGRVNYFLEVLELINILEQYDLKICINTVVHKRNVNSLKSILRLLQNMPNVKKWQLFQFIPSGPIAFKNREKYYISSDMFFKAIFELKKLVKLKKLRLNLDAKSIKDRKDAHIIIDSEGNIWSPRTSKSIKNWRPGDENNCKRIIFGNIKDRDGLRENIERAFDYQGGAKVN